MGYKQWLVALSGLVVIVPIISLVLIGIVLFGTNETTFNETAFVADILLIITYIASLVGIAINTCCGGNSEANIYEGDANRRSSVTFYDSISDHQHGEPSKHKGHSVICITFFFILGVGDSVFNLTRSGDQFLIIFHNNNATKFDCERYIITSIIENVLKSFYQLCILMFILYQLRHPNNSNSRSHKHFIFSLSISCLVQWLLLIFQEIDQEERHGDHCILRTNWSINSFEEVEPFLYPLGMEFRFASFIELLIISELSAKPVINMLKKITEYCSRIMTCCSRIMACCSRIMACCSSIMTCCSAEKLSCKGGCGKLLSSLFLPACGIFLVSVSVVFIFFQEMNSGEDHHGSDSSGINKNHVVTLISEICEVALALIILIHSLYSLWYVCNPKHKNEANEGAKPWQRKFKIDFAFLIIAYGFLCTYSVLTLLGSVNYKSTHPDNLIPLIQALTIIASSIPIVQAAIQVFVIYMICRNKIMVPGRNIDMWIILSFAIWLFDTFSAKKYDTNEIQVAEYDAWHTLGPIFIPIAIFFRFHSCVLFANIKADAYSEDMSHAKTGLEMRRVQRTDSDSLQQDLINIPVSTA